MPTDLETRIAEVREALGKMTPGPYEIAGATVIWSPTAKANIAAASALRATRHVAYSPPDLGELAEPAANAQGIVTILNNLPALLAALEERTEALRPFAKFAEQWNRKPMRQMDDEFYAIHVGTEYEASLRRSDCEKARVALATQAGIAQQSKAKQED